jgi:hypothetical protein
MAGAFAGDLFAGTQQAAHLLGLGVRHEAAANEAMSEQIGQLGRVVHIGLPARQVLHMRGIRQQHFKRAIAEYVPDRLPVDARCGNVILDGK